MAPTPLPSRSREKDECINEMLHAPRRYDGSGQESLSFLDQFDEIVKNADLPHFLNHHKKALTFPESLLFLLAHAEREASRNCTQACISWTSTGRAFVIRNQEELNNKLLPIAYSKAKFSSFTRKLYRWGFRQMNGVPLATETCNVGDKIFWHPQFQRDNKALVAHMKSTTAEGARKLSLKHRNQTQVNRSSVLVASPDSTLASGPTSSIRDRTTLGQPMFSSPAAISAAGNDRDQLISSILQRITRPVNPDWADLVATSIMAEASFLNTWMARDRGSMVAVFQPQPSLPSWGNGQLAQFNTTQQARQALLQARVVGTGSSLSEEKLKLLLRFCKDH